VRVLKEGKNPLLAYSVDIGTSLSTAQPATAFNPGDMELRLLLVGKVMQIAHYI
jgi:hypothetical protein